MRKRIWVLVALVSSTLGAQTRENCPNGPGRAFGIIAYQCANCGFKQGNGERPTYSFFAEPVVVETNRATGVTAGDVIEAVNGKPITTSAGAEQFTYPPAGDNTIAIRRGRDRQVLRVSVVGCDASRAPSQTQFSMDDIERIEVLKGAAAGFGSAGQNGVLVITTKTAARPSTSSDSTRVRVRVLDEVRIASQQRDALESQLAAARMVFTDQHPQVKALLDELAKPLVIVDGVVVDPNTVRFPTAQPLTGRYGFALECRPRCTPATAKDGPLIYTYNRYGGFPVIAAVRRGSAAERAGLKEGDLVIKVGGHSVLEDEGARGLGRLELVEMLRLTVRRDGKDLDYVIRLDR